MRELTTLESTARSQSLSSDWAGLEISSRKAAALAASLGDQVALLLAEAGLGSALARLGRTGEALDLLDGIPVRLEEKGQTNAVACLALGDLLHDSGRDSRPAYAAAVRHGDQERNFDTSLVARVRLLMTTFSLTSEVDRTLLEEASLQSQLRGSRSATKQLEAFSQLAGVAIRRQSMGRGVLGLSQTVEVVNDLIGKGQIERARWAALNSVDRMKSTTLRLVGLDDAIEEVLAETLMRTGAYADAIDLCQHQIALLGSSRLRFRSAFRLAKCHLRLAAAWSAIGNPSKVSEALRKATDAAGEVRHAWSRRHLELTIAKQSIDGDGGDACLKLAEVARSEGMVDLEFDALIAGSNSIEDLSARVQFLRDVEADLPRLSDAFRRGQVSRQWGRREHAGAVAYLRRNLNHFEGTVDGYRSLIRAGIVGTLLQYDPEAAREELDSEQGSLAGRYEPLALLELAATAGSESPLRFERARRAVPTLRAQMTGAASIGYRREAFDQLREGWALALVTLAESPSPADWQASFDLADAAGHGSLVGLRHRGMRGGLALDEKSESLDVRARFFNSLVQIDPSDTIAVGGLDSLGPRRHILFVVVLHEPGESMTGIRYLADRGSVQQVGAFELKGRSLQLVEQPLEWIGGMRADHGDWKRLSEALLGDPEAPDPLLRPFPMSKSGEAGTVVACVDPLLSQIPWCALWIGEKLMLEVGPLQLVPTVALLGAPKSESAPTSAGGALAYCVEHTVGVEGVLDVQDELAACRRNWTVAMPTGSDEFAAALRSRNEYEFAYVASHGVRTPDGSALLHPDGTTFGVREALGCWWPKTVVMSSCNSSHSDVSPGSDPVGLPLAMIVRGAEHVVGCSHLVGQRGAKSLGESVIDLIAQGVLPAEALQQAQLAWLNQHGGPGGSGLFNWAPFGVTSIV